ncbi:MAG: hypothetical protein LBC97_16495, partial [Bifidobacteriaceae bacterium]|nr:hypothetical protein [Bifidobacteriaceae bacterium]
MAAVLFRIIVVFAWRSFHAMAAVPFPISAVFVWRGFHAIRINLKADPVLAEAVPRLYGNISYMTGAEIRPEIFEQVGQGPTRPVTVTISQGTLAAARAVAGPRGTSSLMERALKRELRLEAQRR